MARVAPAPIRVSWSGQVSGARAASAREDKQAPQDIASRPWSAWFEQVQKAVNASVGRVGSVDLKERGASVATTDIATTAPLPAGMYRVSYVARVSRAAAVSSSLQVTIGWTDGVALSKSGAALVDNTTATHETVSFLVRVDDQSVITYATTYASDGSPSMQYSLDIHVEALSL